MHEGTSRAAHPPHPQDLGHEGVDARPQGLGLRLDARGGRAAVPDAPRTRRLIRDVIPTDGPSHRGHPKVLPRRVGPPPSPLDPSVSPGHWTGTPGEFETGSYPSDLFIRTDTRSTGGSGLNWGSGLYSIMGHCGSSPLSRKRFGTRRERKTTYRST